MCLRACVPGVRACVRGVRAWRATRWLSAAVARRWQDAVALTRKFVDVNGIAEDKAYLVAAEVNAALAQPWLVRRIAELANNNNSQVRRVGHSVWLGGWRAVVLKAVVLG